MNEMKAKKHYIWRLANFLEHLNGNYFLTGYRTEYAGGRGTHKLIGVSGTGLGMSSSGAPSALDGGFWQIGSC